MIQESDESIIRKHLLGNLTEEERSHAEERLFADDDYFELLTVIEDELMDEYISGDLTDEDRKRFKSYFLSTPERRDKLRFAQTLKEYVSRPTPDDEDYDVPNPLPRPRPGWWNQTLSSPYLGLAAAAVIVIGIGLAIWLLIPHGPEASKGIAALKEAYHDQRPVESRITGFDYAPPPPVTRGGGQEKFDYVARDRAQALIQLEAAEHPNARSYHDLGRLYLTQHEFDKAIDQFEKALALDDKNAQLHNEYGAALMEMGKADRLKNESGKSLEEFARALEHLTKAIEMDGSLLEALFNRAILYQQMLLPQQAEEDWRLYIEKDPDSKWAEEARQRLKQLEAQRISTAQSKERLFQSFIDAYEAKDSEEAWKSLANSRFRAGSHIVERLLDNYFDAAIQGQSNEASKCLQSLLYAGDLESQKTGDYFTSDLARFYSSTSPSDLTILAQAHRSIKSAQEQDKQSRLEQAIVLYKKAKQLIDKVGYSCEARYIEYRVSLCHLRQPNIKSSLSILEPLLADCGDKKYLWLQARVLNGLSYAHESLSEYSKALEYSRKSLELSQHISDTNGVIRGFIQMAGEYESIGDYSKSLTSLQRGLALVNAGTPDITQAWIIYDVAARSLASFNLYAAAIAYQKETLRLANEMGSPLNLSRGYSHLGLIYGKLNNHDEAIKNAQLSFGIGETLSNESIGWDIMAHSDLHLGHLYKQVGDFSKAITYYDQSIELYDKLNFSAESYEAHKGKLLCHVALEDDQLAARELNIALKLIEQYRYKILEESSRNAFFDNEQDIYDLAIDFEYTKMNNSRLAFEYSEASRARSLLDLYSPTAKVLKQGYGPDILLPSVLQPLKLAELQKQLPEQVLILQYAVLSDKIIMWIVSKTKFESAQEKNDLGKLNEKITDYLRVVASATRDRTEEALDTAKEIYDILIRPVERFLDKEKYICIVPDKSLNYIPFAALVSPTTGNYLIKDFVLGFAPSSTIFLNCSAIARSKNTGRFERMLSVGNPSFDHEEFSSLDELPSSGKEAETGASFYDSSICLTRENARETEVKSEMRNADVIHLATHFVVDERSPMLSKLLLAKEVSASNQDPQTDGTLQAFEICDMRLPRARLAVLSACQTGIERVYRGEGAIGIVRPFIKAGLPLVIASLWPVDSDATSELMISFHKHRKKDGLSTIKALRLAQLEFLKDSDERHHQPFYWASFIPVGGYAPF